jgi:catechol 2,3-dioxygenase-like lactoylglutathione lyase family enzyme
LPKTIPAAEGIRAFYFNDPDRHNHELIYFPPGRGQAKWQNDGGRIFLGIDHTAIGVSNTDSSLRFYRDILGIERKGESWNKGIEQAHLNFVENASLHITGLRAQEGPGLEFLQYLVPGPGRAYPGDSRPDDIWHWQTTLVTDDAEKLYHEFRKLHYRFVSGELVRWQTGGGKEIRAFIVRDGDGHAVLIREPV